MTSVTGRILLVDDDQESRNLLRDLVAGLGHQPETAADGYEALAKLVLGFDLILLDVAMPGMDGFEVAEKIRADPNGMEVPIIMVTGLDSHEDRARAYEAGANDFIAKPVEMSELRLRTLSLLRMKAAQDAVKQQQTRLEELVERRTASLREALEQVVEAQRTAYQAQLETIERLALAAEMKDETTASHLRRVSGYCGLLAHHLGLTPGEVETVTHASLLHDVGKVRVSAEILRKEGALTPEEWQEMKEHTVIGGRILAGSPSPLLQAGEIIALSHHERWDGSGYPRGLAREEIPLWGRICAVADVFDALTSARPYKPALSNNQTCRILEEGRGRHFDPHLVNLFLTHFEEVAAIQERYREESHTEVADDGALDPRPTSISAAGTASRRILVVVHDADVAEMLVDLLELWGHDVRAAHREVEAVQLCVAFRPDLVLVDVGPSPLDGCAVARQLRKQRGTRGTVLVAITPYSSPDRRREFGAADFDDHLLKPIDPEHLQRLVRPPGSGASPTPE